MICVGIDVSMHFGNSSNIQNIPQIFRLYLYIEYYLLGGLVGNTNFEKIKKFCKQYFIMTCILAGILYVGVIVYSIWNRNIIHWVYAEANYGNVLIIFTSVLMLIIFLFLLHVVKVQLNLLFLQQWEYICFIHFLLVN